MKVFADQWISEVKRRYERLPSYQRPPLYRFLTSDSSQEERNEIEQWVNELSLSSQAKLLQKLHCTTKEIKPIISIYHELAISHFLVDLGYQVEYEQNIDGFTPDWYVHPRMELPSFVVEVITDNASDDQDLHYQQLNDLYGRLGHIPIDAVLDLKLNHPDVLLSTVNNAAIAKAVTRWLTATSCTVGARLALEHVTFEIMGCNTGQPQVKCIGPVIGFSVNSRPLAKNLTDKVNKYKNLHLPLVVGVAVHPLTGYGIEEILDVLYGHEVVEFSWDEHEPFDAKPSRLPDGIFPRVLALSTVLWLKKQARTWNKYIIDNPFAELPLPREVWQKQ